MTRLIDMGVERFLLAPMLAGVVAQRLVRRLCPDCAAAGRRDRRPTATCSTARSRSGAPLRRAVRLPGLPRRRAIAGGPGIYEVVTIDRRDGGADPRRRGRGRPGRLARRRGPSLVEDGVRKIREGVTTVEEVARVGPGSTRMAMGAFAYRAVDRAGKAQPACSRPRARRRRARTCGARGLLPVEVAASGRHAGDGPARTPILERLRPGVGSRDLTLITRQLATLIGSGVRIEDALRTVAQQSPPRVAAVLLNVRAAVLDGRSFGQALGDYPPVFPEFYRASIAAGEQSGQLDQVMRHLAAFVENRSRNAQTVQLALLYPALLATVVAGDHHPADGLCRARHRARLHLARRRSAAS